MYIFIKRNTTHGFVVFITMKGNKRIEMKHTYFHRILDGFDSIINDGVTIVAIKRHYHRKLEIFKKRIDDKTRFPRSKDGKTKTNGNQYVILIMRLRCGVAITRE